MKSLSIIVPILNEVDLLEESLLKLSSMLSEKNLDDLNVEVVIVDAGSTDGSIDVAKKINREKRWKLEEGPISSPSIGKTIQKGVAKCEGDYIMVLPVDCELSFRCLEKLKLTDADYGGFFKSYAPSSFLLDIYSFLQNHIRTRFLKNVVWTNAIFAKRELFKREDTFSTDGFMEDVIFSDNLKKNSSSFRAIDAAILVSSRLYFVKKPIIRVFINGLIMTLFRIGFKNPAMLRRIYRFARA